MPSGWTPKHQAELPYKKLGVVGATGWELTERPWAKVRSPPEQPTTDGQAPRGEKACGGAGGRTTLEALPAQSQGSGAGALGQVRVCRHVGSSSAPPRVATSPVLLLTPQGDDPTALFNHLPAHRSPPQSVSQETQSETLGFFFSH